MRISSLTVLLGLMACTASEDAGKVAETPADARIECALGDDAMLERQCAIVRSEDPTMLTVHHPDGGFRRFAVDAAGTLGLADGADDISVAPLADGRIEVSVGSNRYRLSLRP